MLYTFPTFMCNFGVAGFQLSMYYPVQLIGEETSASDGIPNLTDAPTWVVDPLDGTTNFVHRWVDLICLWLWCWTHANFARQFFPKFFSERVLLAKLDVCIVGVMSQQVPFCVCVDWTCHQQSSCCWSGVQPHSWWGTQSYYLFFTFFLRSLLMSFQIVGRWKRALPHMTCSAH